MKRDLYRLNKEIFIKRSNEIHNCKYDYSESEYRNQRTKVKIICPIHGSFYQTPKNHMKGQGCPECGKRYAKEWNKYNYNVFIKSSYERFGDIYEFPNIETEYENSHSKITIKCKKCGQTFVKIACDHITSPNGGCSHCYASKSKPEEEIADYIISLLGQDEIVLLNDRTLLNGNEIDIYIPRLQIGIEFNGLFWHSNKNKNYHLMKTEACEHKNIKLIQIFEDEYILHKDIVKSKLKHLLGFDYDLPKIFGRLCTVHEINYETASNFLENNHIQGKCKSTLYLGAFNKENLYGVMTFTKDKNNNWELTRFATDINYLSIGIGGKLFSYFIKKYQPLSVKSFADRRWTSSLTNNLYTILGFKLESILKPDYKYYMDGTIKRFHKFGFRKKILSKKYGLDIHLTEKEMASKIGAKKIWDCGLLKYVWNNESN